MFEVKTATRKGTPALIGLWGPSNSGKTYSALLIARGLVGPEGKIVLVDTENRRAELYATLAGGWHHIDFQPPFTPPRYMEAMADAEAAGADVIIMDSMSHVWEGEGGVLDMADAGRSKKGEPLQGIKKWQAPKMSYKRMMNALLRSRVHVIFCLRAKEKIMQIGGEIVSGGPVPICEKNFIYEMTVASMLDEGHKPAMPIKVPEDMAAVIQAGKLLTVETGKKIAEWVGGGVPVDHEAEALKRQGRDKAPQGTTVMRDWWQSLTKDERQTLKPILEELQLTARQADAARAEEARAESEHTNGSDDPLDDAFTTAPATPAETADAGPDGAGESAERAQHPIEAG